MKDKEKIVHLLCQASTLLNTKDEQQSLVNFAVRLGLIYGQTVQIDITRLDEPKGITFGEHGTGFIIANALSEIESPSTPVTKGKRHF